MTTNDNHRPPSIATVSKVGTGAKENGASRGELDEAAKQKAEARHLRFFELHTEPDNDAQGPADFS